MRIRAIASILAVTVATASLPTAALAQGMDADTKEAKALFEDGLKLYKAGKPEEARVKFKAAYGLKKRPSIILNLAHAELDTKRPLDAAMLIAQRDFQMINRFAVALESEMARLDNAGVNRSDGDFVNLVAGHLEEVACF